MKILDLCCGVGGAAYGLHLAFPGSDITGVDIEHQPNYPYRFIQADAMSFDLSPYDFIWLSAPYQTRYPIREIYRSRKPVRIARRDQYGYGYSLGENPP